MKPLDLRTLRRCQLRLCLSASRITCSIPGQAMCHISMGLCRLRHVIWVSRGTTMPMTPAQPFSHLCSFRAPQVPSCCFAPCPSLPPPPGLASRSTDAYFPCLSLIIDLLQQKKEILSLHILGSCNAICISAGRPGSSWFCCELQP